LVGFAVVGDGALEGLAVDGALVGLAVISVGALDGLAVDGAIVGLVELKVLGRVVLGRVVVLGGEELRVGEGVRRRVGEAVGRRVPDVGATLGNEGVPSTVGDLLGSVLGGTLLVGAATNSVAQHLTAGRKARKITSETASGTQIEGMSLIYSFVMFCGQPHLSPVSQPVKWRYIEGSSSRRAYFHASIMAEALQAAAIVVTTTKRKRR
jgi:hypothetical protein